jgi:UDP-N-acetyl-D-mannosaminuronic acid dehydrogenase
MTTVCIVGLGYIGLPTAAMLASQGLTVIGYDVNENAVASINSGKPHFHEPDLQMLLSAALNTQQFRAQSKPSEADYFIIAVPTPFHDGKKPDMSYVDAATQAIAPVLRPGTTVILESTCPVGSTERMCEHLAAARPDLVFPRLKGEVEEGQVAIAHCPERILPGQMLRELVSNDRIIGGMTEACAKSALKLYSSFVAGECYLTDARTAEFVKLVENAFRDVNIAFANELSLICDRIGVDVWQAIELANKHPRVDILRPGPGVGGHCIAVDPWFIVHSAPEESRLISAARAVNDSKPSHIVERIVASADRFKNPTIAFYGLAYKADVDDLRESPSMQIVCRIAEKGLPVLVCDPFVKELPGILANYANISLVDADTARDKADIVAFLVGHRAFKRLRPNQYLNKVIVDAIGLMSKPAEIA